MRNYSGNFIQELLSGQGLTQFSVDQLESFLQLIKNEVFDYISNILWICFQVFQFGDF